MISAPMTTGGPKKVKTTIQYTYTIYNTIRHALICNAPYTHIFYYSVLYYSCGNILWDRQDPMIIKLTELSTVFYTLLYILFPLSKNINHVI